MELMENSLESPLSLMSVFFIENFLIIIIMKPSLLNAKKLNLVPMIMGLNSLDILSRFTMTVCMSMVEIVEESIVILIGVATILEALISVKNNQDSLS